MQVFKNYFKILKDHRFSIGLYAIIFVFVLLFTTRSNKTADYKSVKVGIHVKDEAQTDLSKALYDYLDETSNIVEIPDEDIEDKLFYQYIGASITIPKDFEENKEVIFKSAPENALAFQVKTNINSYLSQIDAYEKAGFSQKEAIAYTKDDLGKSVEISKALKDRKNVDRNSRFYFNFYTYSILAQIILVVSIVSLTYKNKNIYKRNMVSPLSPKKINLQLSLGHFITGLVFFFIYMVVYLVIYKKTLSLSYVRLLMLNSLVFTISTVAMAIFLSSWTKKGEVMTAVMNVVSLGTSFLSGAFVPRDYLGPTALKLGKILPASYYIINNDLIVEGGGMDLIEKNILIMLIFTLAFLILSNLVKGSLKEAL